MTATAPRRSRCPGTARVTGARRVVLGGMLLALAACTGRDPDVAAMEMVQYLPMAVVVAKGQEMRRAEEYAANHPGHIALWGISSRPLAQYGTEAAVVVKEMDFGELRRGMTVVYVTEAGTRAGGLLVRQQDNGWVVKDWGARSVKQNLILPPNLVGVVVLAFVPPDQAPDPNAQPIPEDKTANFP